MSSRFKFKAFQISDYAAAAMHDGVILGHDTGGGKGLALFVWPVLKAGFKRGVKALEPNAPVLIVAPGDLHKQVMDEGFDKFKAKVTVLDNQETFLKLSTINPHNGRRELAPGYYITSYTQLGTNGVATFPKLRDCLAAGSINDVGGTEKDLEEHFNFRGEICDLDYKCLNEYAGYGRQISPASTVAQVRDAWQQCLKRANNLKTEFDAAYDRLQHFSGPFNELPKESREYVHRHMIEYKYREFSHNIGESVYVGKGASKMKIKCVYDPSLADLSQLTFEVVSVDEGVKMKGEDTLIGLGVRQMNPRNRLVLTATPIKNRLPDIFRLAWWAAGANADAHARWPYPDETSARDQFAEEFLISERNVTKEEDRGGRFKKLTPQVCNVHRLWKLLAPVVLRRRKKEFGEDIVPKHRHIVRVPMGTRQAEVYKYHMEGTYKDMEGRPAIGPQLQALRIAAANPASAMLTAHPSEENKRLDFVSSQPYIPKLHAALKLIQQILARGEQVVIFSAFQDSLDVLSAHLNQAGVAHVVADGRMSQKRRAEAIKKFKQGGPCALREGLTRQMSEYPVLLAGVESVAEGHSMHLCNNVILMCYSWAFDKFEQAINRAHRLNSPWPVNVYPILCDNSIDRKLEAMIQEKGDAVELVLDGHLLGEHASEVNLAELLNIARAEFNSGSDAVTTVDEVELAKEWPPLRAELAQIITQWSRSAVVPETETVVSTIEQKTQSAEQTAKRIQPEMNQSGRADYKPTPLWRCRLHGRYFSLTGF
jgi:SNF2 family DNA or RNA helicase